MYMYVCIKTFKKEYRLITATKSKETRNMQ